MNANVATVTTLNQALQIIQMTPNLDFIIAETQIEKSETIAALISAIQQLESSIPLIFIGTSPSAPLEFVTIKNPYDVKEVIKATAKILEITAQDMIKLPVPELFPIPASVFFGQDKTICDAYIKNPEGLAKSSYIKILKKDESLKGKFKKYQQENINKIYIPSDFRLRVTNSATHNMLEKLNREPQSDDQRIENTEQAMNVFSNLLDSVDHEVAEEIKNLSESCIKQVSSIVDNVPNLGKLTQLLLKNQNNYIYTHGVLTHYVSSQIIKNSNWGNQEQIDKVGLVLFYHDIYLVPLYIHRNERVITEEEMRNEELSEKEAKVLESHAQLAAALVQKIKKIPHGADTIIMQHHGTKNGIGFTENYPDDISTLAKVVIVAEAFAEQFLKQTEQGQFNLDDTLSYLRSIFKRSSYRNLIEPLSGILL